MTPLINDCLPYEKSKELLKMGAAAHHPEKPHPGITA